MELLKFPMQEFAGKAKKKNNSEIVKSRHSAVVVGVLQGVDNAVLRKQLVSEGAFDLL